jgi:hypothetical protein
VIPTPSIWVQTPSADAPSACAQASQLPEQAALQQTP